jgi:hypothetical protein
LPLSQRSLDAGEAGPHLASQFPDLAQKLVGTLASSRRKCQQPIGIGTERVSKALDYLIAGWTLLAILDAGEIAGAHRDAFSHLSLSEPSGPAELAKPGSEGCGSRRLRVGAVAGHGALLRCGDPHTLTFYGSRTMLRAP